MSGRRVERAWPWRLYGGLTAYLGLPVIAAWIAAAVLAVMFLPDFGAASGFGLIQLVPSNTAALRAQATEQHLVRIVPGGQPGADCRAQRGTMPAAALSRSPIRPRRSTAHTPVQRRPLTALSFALPLSNVPGLISASRDAGSHRGHLLFFPADSALRRHQHRRLALRGGSTPARRGPRSGSLGRCRPSSARATSSRTR